MLAPLLRLQWRPRLDETWPRRPFTSVYCFLLLISYFIWVAHVQRHSRSVRCYMSYIQHECTAAESTRAARQALVCH